MEQLSTAAHPLSLQPDAKLWSTQASQALEKQMLGMSPFLFPHIGSVWLAPGKILIQCHWCAHMLNKIRRN